MCSGESTRALPRVGFPIRKSRDQRLVSISPGLIAAAHVLHRLSAPRHPPCALVLLIEKNTLCCRYGVFKVHGRTPTTRKPRLAGAVSQNSTACGSTGDDLPVNGRGRHIPGEPGHRTVTREWPSTSRAPAGVRAPAFPRKEVIQPQLPLRLPCYDFTPIIDPTFDGSLPCGLGHRLRVLPTFVV
jgi:hypothetical protein